MSIVIVTGISIWLSADNRGGCLLRCSKCFFLILISYAIFNWTGSVSAELINIDFSSGVYSSNHWAGEANRYDQDGFSVYTMSADDAFHETFGTYGPTLAWYEGDVAIRVDVTCLLQLVSV